MISILRTLLQLIFLIYVLVIPLKGLADNGIVVVVNPQVPDKSLTLNTLRAIFGMRMQTWSDGTRIRVFVLSDDSPLHHKFSKEILRVFPYQLRAAWDRLVFSGIGQAPVKVDSVAEMHEKIAHTPGAIGYMWKENLDGDINVLQIN